MSTFNAANDLISVLGLVLMFICVGGNPEPSLIDFPLFSDAAHKSETSVGSLLLARRFRKYSITLGSCDLLGSNG